jgi:hypothetical protein
MTPEMKCDLIASDLYGGIKKKINAMVGSIADRRDRSWNDMIE